jgi:hypothetical protein
MLFAKIESIVLEVALPFSPANIPNTEKGLPSITVTGTVNYAKLPSI